MKKLFTLSFFFLFVFSVYAQKKTYFTSGGEMAFSFANIEQNGNSHESTIRWAPVFNIQTMFNMDMNKHIGVFTGIALRNVGYINNHFKGIESAHPGVEYTYKKKFRSYNVGIPLGIKLGNLGGAFVYGGYEIEFALAYKEKTYDGGDKISKVTGWFSNREEMIQHGFLIGINFPYGANLKFKYYLSNFHNENYVDGSGNKPYAGLKANIFYFSLCTNLFTDFHYSAPTKAEQVY
ncbi:MAG: hypothetical protein WCO63_09075 [Bacteroidota bacterium]